MKKNCFATGRLLISILAIGFVLIGCSSAPKSQSTEDRVSEAEVNTVTDGYNDLTFNGVVYEINSGTVVFFASNYGDLFLDGEEIRIKFDDLVHFNGDWANIAGTYNLSNTGTPGPFSFTSAAVYIGEGKYEINGGTVKITVSGAEGNEIYTIEIDCIIPEVGTIEGTYYGPLDFLFFDP